MKKTAALFIAFFLLASPAFAGGLAGVKAVLKAYIEGRYHWSRVRVEDLAIEGGQPAGLPQSVSLVKGPPGKTVFRLRFADGRQATATATVTAYETVVKSTHLLRANSVVGPEDVSATPVKVTRLPSGGFFNEDSKVVGQVLTCSVGAGVTILDTMVSSAPMVARGHRVTIMIDTPGFRITTPGELVSSARVGGYAKVMNTSSRKMLSGVLVDENTVRIQDGMAEGQGTGGYQP